MGDIQANQALARACKNKILQSDLIRGFAKTKFSQVLSLGILYSKHHRALTFENVCACAEKCLECLTATISNSERLVKTSVPQAYSKHTSRSLLPKP
jgi:hypothetical protein